jgi:homopolymeric O-antigen transport system permease protein
MDGIVRWLLWVKLGWNDSLKRYRRSVVGPFWLTASMGMMITVLGVLYASLFKTPVHDFMPYLCIGILVRTPHVELPGRRPIPICRRRIVRKQVRLPFLFMSISPPGAS